MLLVLSVLLSLSSADMPLFLLAGVFLYCCWYRLLDMLLLLRKLMDHLRNRTPKRMGLIGLASGGGSNEHSTASSRLRWMSNLYISSFSIKAGWTLKYSSDRFRKYVFHLLFFLTFTRRAKMELVVVLPSYFEPARLPMGLDSSPGLANILSSFIQKMTLRSSYSPLLLRGSRASFALRD